MSRLKREEHGISQEVWNARPYVRWEADCVLPVQAAYADLSTKGFMTKIARQFGGYLIARHAPPLGLDKIYAEIRPDEPVFTGPPVKHYHGDGPAPQGLSDRHIHSAKGMRLHIARAKFENDHRGENVQIVHEHHDPAKYVFPPTPKVDKPYFHVHARFKPEKRAYHLERHHADGDTDQTHSHNGRVKDPERDLAKRIDVHPLALPRFKDDVVFFVIEGCVKADAVLSAGAAVFSVPSVTLWDATELPEFAKRYLVNKTVVIVPDMDWTTKSEVITQARLCQTRLRRLGITACVAAPPVSAGYKGVDDFLAGRGYLGDLDVIDRQPKVVSSVLYFNRNDQWERNAGVLLALGMHADSDGCISVPLRTLARIMGMGPKQVERALRQLESMNALAIEGDLTINRRGWVSKSFYSNELDFEERPTIIVGERSRAIDLPPIRLGDYLARKSKVTQ